MKSGKTTLIILSMLLLTAASGIGFRQNSIDWNRSEFDFGLIGKTEKVSTTFTCYNRSGSELIFENILASCGCILPAWPHRPIQPGDSAQIRVEFDPTGKRGRHEKSIAVYSNQGLFELWIKAEIRR